MSILEAVGQSLNCMNRLAVSIWLGATSLTNVSISFALLYHRMRQGTVGRSDSLTTTIVNGVSLTNALVSIVSLIELLLFQTMPSKLFHIIPNCLMSGLCEQSLLDLEGSCQADKDDRLFV